MTIISAHREPDVFFEYAKTAEEKGFKVIIAGAGMAAHLPGMCAAIFPMPVIGIPMHTTSLGGRDSLYSIVQMPSGIPVATVAINGGANAGILAAKILATSDPELLRKVKDYAAVDDLPTTTRTMSSPRYSVHAPSSSARPPSTTVTPSPLQDYWK